MHIGIDARLTYYRTGGISTYIRNLIYGLEKLDPENTYTIFHSRKASETLSTRLRRANLWTPCHHRFERSALTVELARFRLDLFHSPDFIPPRHGARKHIISVHDLSFLHYPQFMTKDSRRYYSDQISAAVHHADHILTISNATRQDIISMLDIPAEKITVQPLGTDDSFYPHSPDQIAAMRKELNLPSEYLLFVGTFEPRKNILGLLQGYHQMLQTLPDAPPIVLAGNRGWLFDETMAHIQKLNIGSKVIWREKIPQPLLPALYSGALALAMPSFYEGFGLPALEAMTCGTVPIVSNRSSLPEVVGDVGIQINPDDIQSLAAALIKAITDNAWRTEQEKLAPQQAAKFTWDECAQITLATYQKIMES